MIEIPKTRLEKVILKEKAEGARITLTEPYFIPNKVYNKKGGTDEKDGTGMIVVANGYTMAVLPVNHDPEDTEGHLPLIALKEGQKDAKKKCLLLAARSDHVAYRDSETGRVCGRENLGRFPEFKMYIPKISDETRFQVALDIDLLSDLADALCERLDNRRKGSRHLILTFDTEYPFHGFLVEPHASAGEATVKGRFGVQMPMHIRE